MTEKEKNLSEAEFHDICEKYMEELGICDDPEELQIVYSDKKNTKRAFGSFFVSKKISHIKGVNEKQTKRKEVKKL